MGIIYAASCCEGGVVDSKDLLGRLHKPIGARGPGSGRGDSLPL